MIARYKWGMKFTAYSADEYYEILKYCETFYCNSNQK